MSDKKGDKSGVVKPTNPAGRLNLPPIVEEPPPPPPPEDNNRDRAPEAAKQDPPPKDQAPSDVAPLEKNLGNILASELASENPSFFPREDSGNGFTEFDRTESLLGNHKHPRDEYTQLPYGTLAYLDDAVKIFADKRGQKPRWALTFLLRFALQAGARDVLDEAYERRCRRNGYPNDHNP